MMTGLRAQQISNTHFSTLDSSGIMVHKIDGSVRTSGLKSWYSMDLVQWK